MSGRASSKSHPRVKVRADIGLLKNPSNRLENEEEQNLPDISPALSLSQPQIKCLSFAMGPRLQTKASCNAVQPTATSSPVQERHMGTKRECRRLTPKCALTNGKVTLTPTFFKSKSQGVAYMLVKHT